MAIILASQSPRRQALLRQMGLTDFRVQPPCVSEVADPADPPERQVEQISLRKARAVRAQAGEDALIIAADTVVALDGQVLGKPKDRTDAARMLTALSGRRHQVYTGLTVLRGAEVHTLHEVSEVTFRPLTPAEITAYLATGEPMDKAGAYGIQGYGAVLVEGISGDYYNVMGLPVCRLARMLARFGVDALALAAEKEQKA